MKRQKAKGAVKARIKRGDEVVFVAGKEFNRYDSEGKRTPYRGKVIAVDPYTGKVKVDGAMIIKKHRKAVPQMNVQGGIIKKEAWVNISNVAVIDPETGKPTRVTYEFRDGAKVRIAKSGAVIPEQSVFARTEAKTEGEESAAVDTAAEETAAEEAVEEKSEEATDTAADDAAEDAKNSGTDDSGDSEEE